MLGSMKVTGLAGGVGGAKLLAGLQRALRPGELTAVVNTGDDARVYGVHVSPDVDIVTYRLAGLLDPDKGWGIAGDSFAVVEALDRLGAETWFGLGDRDLATCVYRTERMRAGASLSEVSDEIREALGVPSWILPMTDDEVRTKVVVDGGRLLDFQTYFVKERHEPPVSEVLFSGIESATAGPGVLEAITGSGIVVVCPSNPILSVGPIVGLPGVREALREHPRVVGITPIVRGAALKGPADRMLADLGSESSASGVASLYADFCDAFVVDSSDTGQTGKVAALGIEPIIADTIMEDDDGSTRLAQEILT